MSNVNEKDILRRLEMLARVKPDADAATQAMDRVRMQLLSGTLTPPAAKPRIIKIWQRPWAKIAVAAIVVFAVTWGGNQWFQPENPDPEPLAVTGTAPRTVTPVMPDDKVRMAALLAEERLEVDRLFAAGDHRGLARMLASRTQPATQATIADRLRQLGDSDDIAFLEAANQRWTGPPEENPFARAIAGIRERLAVQAPGSFGPGGDPSADGMAQAQPNGFQPEGVLSGLITDAAGLPIADLPLDVAMVGGFINRVTTDARGYYSLDMIADPGIYHLRPASPGLSCSPGCRGSSAGGPEL